MKCLLRPNFNLGLELIVEKNLLLDTLTLQQLGQVIELTQAMDPWPQHLLVVLQKQ